MSNEVDAVSSGQSGVGLRQIPAYADQKMTALEWHSHVGVEPVHPSRVEGKQRCLPWAGMKEWPEPGYPRYAAGRALEYFVKVGSEQVAAGGHS
jgi:hypothetical protein